MVDLSAIYLSPTVKRRIRWYNRIAGVYRWIENKADRVSSWAQDGRCTWEHCETCGEHKFTSNRTCYDVAREQGQT